MVSLLDDPHGIRRPLSSSRPANCTPPTLVRGVRFNEFRHPARKVLLTDVGNSKGQFEPSHPGEGARVLFVDGSARTIPWTPRSFDPGIGFGFWVTTRLPGMATEGGSKGVDDFN